MRGFRAKDADRDRSVEVIEAAFVDGQIGDADRELRVTRALSAETLDELETLTRDLQAPAGVAVPRPTRASGPSRQRRAAGVLVALVAFVGLVVAGVTGVVALFVFAVSGEPDSATSQGNEAAPTPIVSEQATAVPEVVAFEMTSTAVRRFVRAYESEFGTLDAYEVGFYPARVGVQVPVRGARPRFERWSYDGTWRQDTLASAVRGPGGVVDLGAIDVRRLFANIETATKTLGVQQGKLTHVLVNDRSEVPTVNIHIANSFDEGGYLTTTLDGDVLRSFPYES